MHKRHRFPPEIIQYAVWLYHRFNLSHRDIADLMSYRGVEVSYESIRLWCKKFGPKYAQRLKRKHQGFGDTFFISVWPEFYLGIELHPPINLWHDYTPTQFVA
jgi:putative transposase